MSTQHTGTNAILQKSDQKNALGSSHDIYFNQIGPFIVAFSIKGTMREYYTWWNERGADYTFFSVLFNVYFEGE